MLPGLKAMRRAQIDARKRALRKRERAELCGNCGHPRLEHGSYGGISRWKCLWEPTTFKATGMYKGWWVAR